MMMTIAKDLGAEKNADVAAAAAAAPEPVVRSVPPKHPDDHESASDVLDYLEYRYGARRAIDRPQPAGRQVVLRFPNGEAIAGRGERVPQAVADLQARCAAMEAAGLLSPTNPDPASLAARRASAPDVAIEEPTE